MQEVDIQVVIAMLEHNNDLFIDTFLLKSGLNLLVLFRIKLWKMRVVKKHTLCMRGKRIIQIKIKGNINIWFCFESIFMLYAFQAEGYATNSHIWIQIQLLLDESIQNMKMRSMETP
jgi:hypothetical protein